MAVFGMVSAVSSFIKIRYLLDKAVIDNMVFRCHYRITTAILFTCCIIVTANNLIGKWKICDKWTEQFSTCLAAARFNSLAQQLVHSRCKWISHDWLSALNVHSKYSSNNANAALSCNLSTMFAAVDKFQFRNRIALSKFVFLIHFSIE